MRCRRFPLALGLLALAAALAAANAQAKTLKIATLVPAGTAFLDQLRTAGDTISERTQGRVKLKLFPGGVMGNDSAVLRKIKIGQLQGAVVTATGLQEIHPDAQVYSMPFVFRSYDEVEYVRERIDPVIRERLRSRGFVAAGISEGGFTYLFSKQPIRRLEDLKNARVWVPQGDSISARMFQNAGSEPVSLPVSDVFTSLQTGLVDTVAITPTGAIALQWHTGVGYQADAPLLFLVGMLVFDQRALEGIEPADREVLMDVMHETFERLDRINRENNEEATKALRAQGIELVEPARPPQERRWAQIARETLDNLAREGEFDPALLDRVRSLVDEYRQQHGG